MVRNYKRKTDRGIWEEDDMRRAVRAVLNETMGFLRASATYNVPKSTLERRVRKARCAEDADTDSDNDYGKKKLGRYKTVFNKEQEEELSQYIKSMEARLFGITGKELRILAFQLAERNHIENPFNAETGMAGEDWLSGFLKRHPELSFRRPEPTSAARAMAFNKVAVNEFFTLLESVVEEHCLTPDRIYNVDETGVSTVPKSQSKILSLKGQKQVGCLSSAERGQLVTAEICFNAAGTYVPPMLIYARKRMKNELLDDAPPGFWGTCSDNGCITSQIFYDWFKKFVETVKPTKEKPVLLLLDGHASHTKNLDLIDYAREHHVILLCTPPHCTHKLQPLDVAFMRPLSTYYGADVKKWLRDHPGRVVSPYQVAKLFGQAYLQAATMLTAINGFRKCGIWPLDRNVFTEADFIAAETTNTETLPSENLNLESISQATTTSTSTPLEATQQMSSALAHNEIAHEPTSTGTSIIESLPSENQNIESTFQPTLSTPAISEVTQDEPSIPAQKDISTDPAAAEPMNTEFLPQPSTSAHLIKEKTPERQIEPAKSSFSVTPENIMSIPKEVRTQKRKIRKRGKTAILTASPYKNDLIKDMNKKQKINKTTDKKKPGNKKTEKKRPEKKKPEKKNKNKRHKKQSDTESSSVDDENDCPCIYCGYLYSQSTEGWVICSVCYGWAHNSCAGVDDDDEEAHICERCQPD